MFSCHQSGDVTQYVLRHVDVVKEFSSPSTNIYSSINSSNLRARPQSCCENSILWDRIDIHIEVPAVAFEQLSSKEPGESSEAIRNRVLQAREVQRQRFGEKSKVRSNSRMTNKHHRAFCRLDQEAEGLIQMAMTELHLSARAYDRILKVARTIADLEACDVISSIHVGEAIQYRTLDRNLWA